MFHYTVHQLHISFLCAPSYASLQTIVLASVELRVNVASDAMIEPPQSHDPIILSTFPKAQLKATIFLQIKKLSALAAVHFHKRKGDGSWPFAVAFCASKVHRASGSGKRYIRGASIPRLYACSPLNDGLGRPRTELGPGPCQFVALERSRFRKIA